jgi:transposase-like protein
MSVSGQAICRLAEEAADARDPEVALNKLTELRQELDEFERQQVARSLTAGSTFGSVARALGISRQAVHRRFRHLSPRSARSSRSRLAPTPEVRLAIEYARAEAAALGTATLTPELVLVGVLRNGDRRGASALAAAGVTLEDTRRQLGAQADGSQPGHPSGARSVDIRPVLAEAVRCASRRGTTRVEVEHLLRAALSDADGNACRLLRSLRVAPEDVLAELDATPPDDPSCLES